MLDSPFSTASHARFPVLSCIPACQRAHAHSDLLVQDFYAERDRREKRFQEMKDAAEPQNAATYWSMEMFSEDWNASQFWVRPGVSISAARS